MLFWIFMVLMTLLIPVVMVGCGWLFLHHPPKTINGFYGYRTKWSGKSQETWAFAHTCCGKIWIKLGWFLVPISILAMLPVFGQDKDLIGTWGGILTVIQSVVMVVTIVPVERALRKNFDEYGRKR